MSSRRIEHFKIVRHGRRYDRETGKFIVNIAYQTATVISPRTVAVSEAFGLGVDEEKQFVLYDNVELKISPKDIVLITGDSGSGKSVLLKALQRDVEGTPEVLGGVINIADVNVDQDKPLIETVGRTVEEGLELVSRVGLNDAFLFLRSYSQLSDGQRYRYRIAKMIESGAQWWVMAEFCATLDRDTAKIVAFNVQKLARQNGRAVLAATTHTDLFEDLHPSVHVHKRFGKEICVVYYTPELGKECSLLKEIRIEQGTTADYRSLAEFHYRSHRVGAVRKIFRAMRGDELCGVIVYVYVPICQPGRKQVLAFGTRIKELNEKLSLIMRVVVHPKYRTVGLGQRLVRETLAVCGTPCVETIAVMAKYNPFFEKAGMRKIRECGPSKEACTIRDLLLRLGFDLTFLGSPKYVLAKLQDLRPAEISAVREVFQRNIIPRLVKEFQFDMPYGKHELYRRQLSMAPLEKLTRLINIVALLLQTKVYLFWENA